MAWIPLAPGDIYYGDGFYGPGSVNISNININNFAVKGFHRNAHVYDAVTVISPASFIKDKYNYKKPGANPFFTNRINIGRPQIKPEKSVFKPIIKEIPKTYRPPQKIRDIQIKELKKERLLVKEKKASVLSPEARQKKMPVRTLDESSSLKTRLYIEKESTPKRKIQVTEKKNVPKAQTQSPAKIQKSQRDINIRNGKSSEPLIERTQLKPTAYNYSRFIPQKSDRKQIQKETISKGDGKNIDEVKKQTLTNELMQDTEKQGQSGFWGTRTPFKPKSPVFH